MFGFDETTILQFFADYAYQPMYVYGFVMCFMLASAFGLPIPEELTLVSAGLVANMAKHPDKYPPPYPGAKGVDTLTLCIVCFLAVLLSDLLIFMIGKYFGARIVKMKFFQKRVAGAGFDKINLWFQKYGGWACGIFRFTPGLRFPGHLSCGFLGISVWKFLAIDMLAAGFSVPTQVYFVSNYGEDILLKIKEFKIVLLVVLGVLFLGWLIRRIYLRSSSKSAVKS
jgi:membrane protein DedA with SNARE-associated domain